MRSLMGPSAVNVAPASNMERGGVRGLSYNRDSERIYRLPNFVPICGLSLIVSSDPSTAGNVSESRFLIVVKVGLSLGLGLG